MSTSTVLMALALAAAAAGWWIAAVCRARLRDARERLARTERERADLEALVRDAPAAPLAPNVATPVAALRLREMLGLDAAPTAVADLRPALAGTDATSLRAAVDELTLNGTPFTMTVAAADGGRWLAAEGWTGAAGPVVWFTDVTQREHRRGEAAAAADTLSRVVEHLPVPVWRRDADLRLAGCNRAFAHLVGVSPGDAVARNIDLPSRGEDAPRDPAREARDTGAPAKTHVRFVVEGQRRSYAITEQLLPDGTLAGVAVDRTEADELRADLDRRIEAHNRTLEELPTGIVIYGADLRVRYANSAVARIWDVPDSIFAGEPHVTDVIEALRERRRLPEQADFRAYKREAVSRMQDLLEPQSEHLHCPDGRTLHVRTAPHTFGGVVVLYEDVTDRISLERDVNTLMQVQRETIDNLYEGVAVFGTDGRLTLCNQAYRRIWNLSPELVAHSPHVRELTDACRDLFPVSQLPWERERERIAGNASEPQARHGRMERPDGMVLDWAQIPLPDGQSLFTYVDVTDSTRVERALRERAEALATTDRLKSEFIANVSYELRTPLNAIVGFAEILQNQFFGELNERQHDYANAIVAASQRLIGLVNDILDLATIEAGYLELSCERVDIAELFRDLHTLAHERARNRRLTLEVACPDDIGTIVADPRRLKQALFNLLSNAFNYTPPQGTVTLAAERAGDTVRLAVIDTGVGIQAPDQDRVFDKFERGHPRTAGPGLGLSLVQRLAELHGGRVELVSQPNTGTRVTCVLPVDASPERVEAEQAAVS